jgi:lipoate-protein ligase B
VLADFGIQENAVGAGRGTSAKQDRFCRARCQRWVSSHGTSLNVNIDLSLFDSIISCGEPRLRQTSIQRLSDAPTDMPRVKNVYLRAVRQIFGWELLPVRNISFDLVETELGLES